MKIQINTAHNVSIHESMIRQTEAVIESTLGHFGEHITRVEVHLSDENSKKDGSHDKRCLMEARLEGHQPVAVTHEAENIDQAIHGAVDKLKRTLDHTLGRLSDRMGRKHENIKTLSPFADTL
jgi:ribosome-associated translation inhibitor RaiA